jgi:hypothetical protein
MPDLIINELSAAGQMADVFQIDALMHDLANNYKALNPLLCGGKAYGHSGFGHGRLTQTMTARDWLSMRHSGAMLTVKQLILFIVNKAPKIDTWLQQHAPNHSCRQRINQEMHDRAFSSLAGAAHLEGWLLSLRDCTEFPAGPFEVDYCEEGDATRTCQIEHFVLIEDVQAKLLTYEPNPKHNIVSGQNQGMRISPMDLTDEEAQSILNCARNIPGEKRLFAFHKGKIYIFFEHLERRYHGFLLENPREYQQRDAKIYNQLLAWGWID